MRKTVIVILLIVFFGACIGYFSWPTIQEKLSKPERPSPIEEARDLEEAQGYIDASEPAKAYKIIRKYDAYITPLTSSGKKWLDLLIRASEELPNARQILTLYEYFPEEFDMRENSAVLIAQSYINENRSQDYDELRDKWRSRETRVKEWFLLDADKHLLDGDHDKAISFLKSQSFKNSEDTARLMRLSLLVVEVNPREAWGYLKEALDKDPDNPSIRLYRGKLLEAAGKEALALSEFIAAVQTKPENMVIRDQLSEFFLRYYQYPQALEVWENTIKEDLASDFILLKAWFWGRLTTPTSIDWDNIAISDGTLKPYLEYLIGLDHDEYWNTTAFDKTPNRSRYLKFQQSSLWLRLIQALKEGNEEQALQLIKSNPFSERSWHPDLEVALERILTYRKKGTLTLKTPVIPDEEEYTIDHDTFEIKHFPFFKKLEELAGKEELSSEPIEIPADIDALLRSDDAFSAAFLAGGWYEVAIDLQRLAIIPETFPRWLAYGYTQAIRHNQGPIQALEYATRQIPSPDLTLLTGELLIATGSPDAALDTLIPLTRYESGIGRKAMWMVSMIYINKKEYTKAEKMINANTELSNSVLGQELHARIATLQGKTPLAGKIYSSILEKSAEAKSYFARKAYAEKNWYRARKLTEELLVEYPNNITIRKNLQKIIDEQKNQQIER